ncbi:MAG: ATP-binding cassette domain-containing protein [Defluviitaleaceae bacterium]|nr:ATP-binding cassette domain-containing protein [Defluviitaleaceae bacterium]
MININNLNKKYSSKIVLDNINLKLDNNKIHFLVGKNGSGKTTLFKCLLGLEKYEGDIFYNELSLVNVRNKINIIFDDVPFYNNLNGYQNIKLLTIESKEMYSDKLILDLLTNKKLTEKVKNYSLGERKKLAIICSIILKPKYLFLDEISNGLDIETSDILKNILTDLKKDCLIIATGHHFDFYKDIVDDLLILNNGNINHLIDYKKNGDNIYDIYKKYTEND